RHEVDAADHEQGCVELGGAARHLERIGNDISQILDFRTLVVMGQDRGAPFFTEGFDLGDEIASNRRVCGDAHRIQLPLLWWRGRGADWVTPWVRGGFRTPPSLERAAGSRRAMSNNKRASRPTPRLHDLEDALSRLGAGLPFHGRSGLQQQPADRLEVAPLAVLVSGPLGCPDEPPPLA